MPFTKRTGSLILTAIACTLSVGVGMVADEVRGSDEGAPTFTPYAPGNSSALGAPLRIVLGQNGDLLVTDFRHRRVLTVGRESLEVAGAFVIDGRPTALGFHNGEIYVGNETSGRIDVFDLQGQLLRPFADGISMPNDLAISPDTGAVYVVSSDSRVVKVYDAGGMQVATIPAPGQQILGNPSAVALHRRPCAADIDQNEVVGFSDLLSLLSAWGPCNGCPQDIDNSGAVQFADLLSMLSSWGTCPATIEVLVSDFGGDIDGVELEPAIRVYDESGQFLRALTGAFSRPQGLVVNGDGDIYVADSLLSRILIMDVQSGELRRKLGQYGVNPGDLYLPLDVAIDAVTGDVFVTNSRLSRIEAFRSSGQTP